MQNYLKLPKQLFYYLSCSHLAVYSYFGFWSKSRSENWCLGTKRGSKRAWGWGLLYSMAGTQKDVNVRSSGTKQAVRYAATVAIKQSAGSVLRRAPLVCRTTVEPPRQQPCMLETHLWEQTPKADPRGWAQGPVTLAWPRRGTSVECPCWLRGCRGLQKFAGLFSLSHYPASGDLRQA